MKRNLLIVLILVLIGGGFMYLNTNTDFFKGALTTKDPTVEEQVLNPTPLNGKHFIDFYRDSRLPEAKNCIENLTTAYVQEDCYSETDLNNEIMALIKMYNLSEFDTFKAKLEDGIWVECESESESGCKSLSDLGYTKENMQQFLNLKPYTIPQTGINTTSTKTLDSTVIDSSLTKDSLQQFINEPLLQEKVIIDPSITVTDPIPVDSYTEPVKQITTETPTSINDSFIDTTTNNLTKDMNFDTTQTIDTNIEFQNTIEYNPSIIQEVNLMQ